MSFTLRTKYLAAESDRPGMELADFLCIDRSAMASEISKLRREGVLESEKNHFKLLAR